MATPDMKDAAEAPDTQVGVPEETVVFPRLRAGETMAGAGEPVAPAQASGAISAERFGDDEPQTAIQTPLAGTGAPKVPPDNRPPDITRPQLILDDTVVDVAGLRGGWSSRQTADGSGAADPARADGTSPADGDAAPADAGDPPSGKAAKRSRSVFGPEPASRPDMLTNADTVVMASLKGQKGSLDGSSARAEEAANARNAAVKQQAITAMVPAGTSAAFAEAATQILPTVEPSALAPGTDHAPPGKPR